MIVEMPGSSPTFLEFTSRAPVWENTAPHMPEYGKNSHERIECRQEKNKSSISCIFQNHRPGYRLEDMKQKLYPSAGSVFAIQVSEEWTRWKEGGKGLVG
jgi:hypothetical protein